MRRRPLSGDYFFFTYVALAFIYKAKRLIRFDVELDITMAGVVKLRKYHHLSIFIQLYYDTLQKFNLTSFRGIVMRSRVHRLLCHVEVK